MCIRDRIETRGLTETIIGNWFKQGNGRREKVVLGTKVGRVFEKSDLDGPNNVEGLSLYKIRRHCLLYTSRCV